MSAMQIRQDETRGDSGMKSSIRQELLPKDALDLIAHWFTIRTKAGVAMVRAVEVTLDGCQFVPHRLPEKEHLYSHHDDPAWAVVISSDCAGDAERGRQIASIHKIGDMP